MAGVRNREGSEYGEILTLHEMFRIVGDQMTPRDVRVLKFLYTGTLCDELRTQINDGYTFLLALEKIKKVDESNFKCILDLLKIITRHDLTQFVTLRKRKPVTIDPVDTYLESKFKSKVIIPFSRKRQCPGLSTVTDNDKEEVTKQSKSGAATFETVDADQTDALNNSPAPQESRVTGASGGGGRTLEEFEGAEQGPGGALMSLPPDESSWIPPSKRRRLGESRGKKRRDEAEHVKPQEAPCRKVTCDIRLRVRAEYCNHQSVLQGNVFSNKPTLIERQFEKFLQANTILKSRDLGSIHCDIKFSELTYLDAFWRDYVNGSLLEALKGVFITESLKQAVGHEAIKLLVNVDEDDYNNGRLKLLQNLMDRHHQQQQQQQQLQQQQQQQQQQQYHQSQ